MSIKRGSLILINCIVLSCLLVGCKFEKPTDDLYGVTSKPEPTEAVPLETAEGEPEDEDSEEQSSEDEDPQVQDYPESANSDNEPDPDINNFYPLSDYFKDYDFVVNSDINSELYTGTYEISGEYDLNGDGNNENIQSVLSNAHNVNSYVKVNDMTVELYTDNPTGEVRIIDLDSNDNYLEMACFDDGPSGDPHYKLFRYNGEELVALGEIDSGAIMDGRGRFISWFDLGVNFTPQFYTSWRELVDNEFIYRDHDVNLYIGETYELSGSGFFVPLDEAPDNYHEYMIWEWEAMKDFEVATIKILDIYTANVLFIEFEDGQRGLLYFWIGD